MLTVCMLIYMLLRPDILLLGIAFGIRNDSSFPFSCHSNYFSSIPIWSRAVTRAKSLFRNNLKVRDHVRTLWSSAQEDAETNMLHLGNYVGIRSRENRDNDLDVELSEAK